LQQKNYLGQIQKTEQSTDALLSNDTTSFGAIVYFICSANVFVLQSDSLWIELAKLSTMDNSDQKGKSDIPCD